MATTSFINIGTKKLVECSSCDSTDFILGHKGDELKLACKKCGLVASYAKDSLKPYGKEVMTRRSFPIRKRDTLI